MTSQVLPEQSSGVRAFTALLRAHALATRRLSAELTCDHGLTLNDYEVLLRLARAPERRLRGVDLAASVLLTPSGITRLLDGLEQSGLIERITCTNDRRAVWAILTEAGLDKLRAASATHLPQIDALFEERLEPELLEALSEALERLAGREDALCGDVGD